MPINFKKAPPNMSGPPTGEDMDIVGSHQRCLLAAALRTEGPILELGVGWYSTPLLHEIATVQKRKLYTFDNQPYWLPSFKPLQCEHHDIICVGWWPEMYDIIAGERFGLIFVDQGQPIEREYSVRHLLEVEEGKNAVYVMHDTEELHAYGYERTLPLFRYKVRDECQTAWTTIASNAIDVTRWRLRFIGPHKPSKEIT